MTREEMLKRAEVLKNKPIVLDYSLFPHVDYKESVIELESTNDVIIKLFKIESEKKSRAAILNIHGGGFVRPRLERDELYSAFLSSTLGCTVFDLDYSISPYYRFPQALDDAVSALSYIARNAEYLDIDRENIALSGHSAGGNLCIGSIVKSAIKVKALLAEYSPCDFFTSALEKVPHDDDAMVKRAMIEDEFALFYRDEEEGKNPFVSPIYLSSEELRKLPKTLLITAGYKDTLTKENEKLYENMKNAGVDVRLLQYLESNHGFTISRTGEWEKALEQHIAFFKETII